MHHASLVTLCSQVRLADAPIASQYSCFGDSLKTLCGKIGHFELIAARFMSFTIAQH